MISLSLKLMTISFITHQRQGVHDLLVSRQDWNKEYDYIVVGAGSAGCVVAARLAENNKLNVLLLEAGGPQTVKSDTPGKTAVGSELDWNYPIVPQKYAYFANSDRQNNIPRGRVFGGSSVLNGMNYYRDSPEYFDLLYPKYGIKNWSFSEVLPYFLRSENNTDQLLVQQNIGFHSTSGPLAVSTSHPEQMYLNYIKAAKIMGYPETYTDGRHPFGVTILQKTIKDGIRQSSATAFLEPNKKSNLHTIGYSLVTKILFNKTKNAIGVEFKKNGSIHSVKARKEIIISAGTIGTPQLLMLSGIGPKEHLKEHNISVISDLRVGDGMRQAIPMALYFDIKNQPKIQKSLSNNDIEYEYLVEHKGPLADIPSVQLCFNVSNNTNIGCDLPSVEFFGGDLEGMVYKYELKNEWTQFYRPYMNRQTFTLFTYIRRPKSRGTVRLASVNPLDYPIIDPCIFCEKSDIDELVEAINKSLSIYSSPYFRQFIQIFKNPIPGCNPCPDKYFCYSYLKCVAQTTTTYFTPSGTCRMGSANDVNSVVDELLRVKGVLGLRVIDSSVLPIPSEHTNAITIMVGERGSQLIKDNVNSV